MWISALIAAPAFAATTIGSLNDYIQRESFLETVMTKQSAPTAISDAGEEHINKFSGSVSYVKTELSLPGKAGHDLVIKRSFDSGENLDINGNNHSLYIYSKGSDDNMGDFNKYVFKYYENGDTTKEPLFIAYDSVYDMLKAENGTNQICLSANYTSKLTDLKERVYSRVSGSSAEIGFYWELSKNAKDLTKESRVLLYEFAPTGNVVFKRDLNYYKI